jgi:hypothetical protein
VDATIPLLSLRAFVAYERVKPIETVVIIYRERLICDTS